MGDELKEIARPLGCKSSVIRNRAAKGDPRAVIDVLEDHLQERASDVVKVNIDALRAGRFYVLREGSRSGD